MTSTTISKQEQTAIAQAIAKAAHVKQERESHAIAQRAIAQERASAKHTQQVSKSGSKQTGKVKASAGKAPAFVAHAGEDAITFNTAAHKRNESENTMRNVLLVRARESVGIGNVDEDSHLTAWQSRYLESFEDKLEHERKAKAKEDNVIRVYKSYFALMFRVANAQQAAFLIKGETGKPKARPILDTLAKHKQTQKLASLITHARMAKQAAYPGDKSTKSKSKPLTDEQADNMLQVFETRATQQQAVQMFEAGCDMLTDILLPADRPQWKHLTRECRNYFIDALRRKAKGDNVTSIKASDMSKRQLKEAAGGLTQAQQVAQKQNSQVAAARKSA